MSIQYRPLYSTSTEPLLSYITEPALRQHTCDTELAANECNLRLNGTQTKALEHRGRHLSYQRGKRNTNPGTSLIKIEGVDDTKAANFYLGKKIAYVYRAQKEVRGSKIRVIWGKVTRPHGNSGVVRAQFRKNLPPKTFGASVRIMLYPSSI
ncbi:60S ribosomal protein L33B [Oleoguttula sp. CCFEE 6159]|nr:60S ribosomal protein L33B [Oleoguttula sp. CCFEE 6159]